MKGTGLVGAVTAGLRGGTVYLPPRGGHVRLAIVASMLAAGYDAAGMNKIMSLAKMQWPRVLGLPSRDPAVSG